MTRRPFLLAAVALGTCWACGTLDPDEDADPLTFEVREVDWFSPPASEPQIVLFVATEEQYPCMNYQLESELGVQDHTIRVEVSGRITIGEVCLTAIGPAQYKSVLPITEGTYALEFSRGDFTDRYTLSVSETAIEITTREAHFTRPTADRFFRGG